MADVIALRSTQAFNNANELSSWVWRLLVQFSGRRLDYAAIAGVQGNALVSVCGHRDFRRPGELDIRQIRADAIFDCFAKVGGIRFPQSIFDYLDCGEKALRDEHRHLSFIGRNGFRSQAGLWRRHRRDEREHIATALALPKASLLQILCRLCRSLAAVIRQRQGGLNTQMQAAFRMPTL